MNVTDLNRQNTNGTTLGGIVFDDKRNEKHSNDVKPTTESTKRRASLRNNNKSVWLNRPNDNDGNNNECDDSSVVYSDSDSDFDDIVRSPASLHNDLNKSSSSGIMMIDTNLDPAMPRHASVLCANEEVKPNIGSIAVQNSSDITFGNKTFYQGPVTIKQFVYDKNNKWKETELPPAATAAGAASATKHDNLGPSNICTDKLSQMGRCTFSPI